jgi:hypothetical protein
MGAGVRALAVLLALSLLIGGFSAAARLWLEQEEGSLVVDDKKHKLREVVMQRTGRRLAQAWAVLSRSCAQRSVPFLAVPVAACAPCSCIGAIRAGSGTPLRC